MNLTLRDIPKIKSWCVTCVKIFVSLLIHLNCMNYFSEQLLQDKNQEIAFLHEQIHQLEQQVQQFRQQLHAAQLKLMTNDELKALLKNFNAKVTGNKVCIMSIGFANHFLFVLHEHEHRLHLLPASLRLRKIVGHACTLKK